MLVIVSSFFAHPHGGGFAKGHWVKNVIVPGWTRIELSQKGHQHIKMTCPGHSAGIVTSNVWGDLQRSRLEAPSDRHAPFFFGEGFWKQDFGETSPPKKKQKNKCIRKKKKTYKINGSPKNLSWLNLGRKTLLVWHPNTPFWQVTMPVTTIVALWMVSQRMLSL